MTSQLYGIDYVTHYCGGLGNVKLMPIGKKTVFFYTESDMLKTLAELKRENGVDNISVFTTPIQRMEYKI